MMNGTIPFKSSDMSELQKLVMRGKFKYVNTNVSESVKDLVSKLICVDVEKRVEIS